jgi:hypothetical protein
MVSPLPLNNDGARCLAAFGLVAHHLHEGRAQLLLCHADNEEKMKGVFVSRGNVFFFEGGENVNLV